MTRSSPRYLSAARFLFTAGMALAVVMVFANVAHAQEGGGERGLDGPGEEVVGLSRGEGEAGPGHDGEAHEGHQQPSDRGPDASHRPVRVLGVADELPKLPPRQVSR